VYHAKGKLMQNVASMNLKSLVGQEPNYQVPAKTTAIPDGAIRTVNQLFIQLRAIFPAWKNSFPDADSYREAKRIWLETLVNEKITTIEQLQNGIARAKKSKNPFWPSVGEFVEWCKTVDYEALGLPDEDKLYKRLQAFMRFGMEEIQQFKFVSTVEYYLITDLYVRCRTGEWSDKQLKDEIKKSLVKMSKRLKTGEVLPEPKLALPEEVKAVNSEKVMAFWGGLLKQVRGRR
ncbi:replication protein P, partial [Glaesserella parasuis]|nr:replication protein P [Glaesserella parasuis]MDE4001037.1 replication protein P [Glaesserella parasuis]